MTQLLLLGAGFSHNPALAAGDDSLLQIVLAVLGPLPRHIPITVGDKTLEVDGLD